MKAALLPDRGVIKVTGDDARNFLHGLVSADILTLKPGVARFCALLTPQGKIMVDMIVAEAPTEDGGGFFIDCPRALRPTLIGRLNFYKLRAKAWSRTCPRYSACWRCGTARARPSTACATPIRV